MKARLRNAKVAGFFVLLLAVANWFLFPLASNGAALPGYANLTGSSVGGPEWTDLFEVTGNVKNLVGGQSAAFIEDNISAGIATDMSRLIGDDFVDNGTVLPINDLGNAYAYRTTDAMGNIVLFAGVEHLGVAENSSYIEIEFTQDKVQVWSGVPWKIHGQRNVGDLVVRFNLISGGLYNIEFKRYTGDETNGYQVLETAWPLDGQACNASDGLYAFCSGVPITGLAPTNADVWDLWGVPVQVPAADRFIEVGVNVGRLLGINPDFSGFTVKSPEDIAFGTGLLMRRD